MMHLRKIIILLLILVAVTVIIVLPHIVGLSATEKRHWEARARATADDPRAARQVILDGIWAGKTYEVAQAYEDLLQEKPLREARIANFGHAVALANRFCNSELLTIPGGDRDFFRMEDHARRVVQSVVQPPDPSSLQTETQSEEARNFRPTRIADAWLAWAMLAGGYQDYRRALELDPQFGEAYYDMVEDGAWTRSGLPIAVQRKMVVRSLNLADQLEPKLHPLVTFDRYLMAKKQGNNKVAITYLHEYLRAWPTAFEANILRQQLAQMEAAEKKHDAT